MKPMLKTAFFSAVKSLLADGCKPAFYTVCSGTIGLITWVDGNGNKQVEQVYSCSTAARNNITPRFQGWFNTLMAEYHAEIAEKMSLGEKVLDGKTERTVTGFRTEVVRSANGTPRKLVRTGVVVLDEQHEAMAGDLAPAPVPVMTPMQAVQHMAYTLAGVIEQSKKPGFKEEEAYADIQSSFNLVRSQCEDLAIKVWLQHWICFWSDRQEVDFAELNRGKLNRLEHILSTGWLPSSQAGATIHLNTLIEMNWWGANDIKITMFGDNMTHGTATVTDEEGLYQIAFEWEADEGEAAKSMVLPVLISITAARFTLPYDVTLTDCDPLEVMQEMDCVLGLSADIVNYLKAINYLTITREN